MELFGIIIFILGLGLLIYASNKIKNQKQVDEKTEEINRKLETTTNYLKNKKEQLVEELKLLEQQEQSKIDNIKKLNESAVAAFEQYVATLESSYDQVEREFENSIETLDISYASVQDAYLSKIDLVKQDLDKISATRAAAIEAKRQEKLVKENKNFKLNLTDTQKSDVLVLERVKKELTQPRILSMLIWQTYFKDGMNELCNYVLGTKTICGIYKITNQITDECYIGQSVDISKRWKDHAKCGLDIDRPQGNKLYQAMIEDNLWNFTFELLEECPREQLNEKEKFYIELYQSKEFGYNGTGGNR